MRSFFIGWSPSVSACFDCGVRPIWAGAPLLLR
jgi:hypothetical protein